MTRLKLATLCLLLAIAALLLAGVPNQASAKGICSQIKKQIKKDKFPEKACVTRKDVRKNSLSYKDLKTKQASTSSKA